MENLDEIARKLAGNLSPDQVRERWEALENGRFKPAETVAITDEGRKHLARVSSKPTTGEKRDLVKPALKQEMDYQEARKKICRLLEIREGEITILENRSKPFYFEFDKEEIERNVNLLKYFINDPTAEYDGKPLPLTKGLFVFGAVGTGKTELMLIFERFCKENDLSKQFQFSSLSKIYTDAKADANFDPIAPNICFSRCFDEFGRYTGAVKRYGDDLDINEAILEQRYDRFKRYGQLTHLISNMDTNEAKDKFSPMLFDRVRSMCTGIYFKGESKRK